MKNKKGFTLLEFLLVLVIILVVTTVALPFILYAIKNARMSAFKTSASNVLDSAEYDFAKLDYVSIPVEGISIEELNLGIKNNDFDRGLIKEHSKNKLELVYLEKGNYCAKGTKENLKVTDAGCGALDETAPKNVYLYLKKASNHSLTILVSTDEIESDIISYEYSIDHQKYNEGIAKNEYTFSSLEEGEHTIKVRVTNEAGLQTESESYSFFTHPSFVIDCVEQNQTKGYKVEANVTCTYPVKEGFIYEYSIDHKTWNQIELEDDHYTFHQTENGSIYTRVIQNEKVIAIHTINIHNIDPILKGADPELLENMIPIVYDETRKIWIKADARVKYFDYQNKQYANAVFVRKNADPDDPKSKSREYYLSNRAIGEEIYEEDIIGYYVWIPRYKYQLFNVSNKKQDPQTINIEFEGKNIPKSNGQIEGTYTNHIWYTHPAFTKNGIEYNGFWISKFQNSAGKSSSCYLTKEVSSCNSKSISLYSLPNTDSITNVSISNAHLMSENMMNTNNMYGLRSDAFAHVMTNLEWGAVAYLANSDYGINNSQLDEPTNFSNSMTGNITGVYDMAHLFSEMVMANYKQDAGKSETDHSGFKDYGEINWPNIIDYYQGITPKSRILGDATGETEGWYGSTNQFINGEQPFMIRGGTINGISSLYHFTNSTGNAQKDITFRIAFVKKEGER